MLNFGHGIDLRIGGGDGVGVIGALDNVLSFIGFFMAQPGIGVGKRSNVGIIPLPIPGILWVNIPGSSISIGPIQIHIPVLVLVSVQMFEQYRSCFFFKNTQNCFAYISATKYSSEAVQYSKRSAGYTLSPHIKTIAVAFLQPE